MKLMNIINYDTFMNIWNNTWEIFFPIIVYRNHWILIVVNKTVKQVRHLVQWQWLTFPTCIRFLD
jgi:hypothetical protein